MGIDARMFFLSSQDFDREEVTQLAHRLYEAFYGEPFFLYGDDHIITKADSYEQDGPDFEIPVGYNFYEIALSSRFYGEGYERGPIHDHIAIARWIEGNVKDAKVFYGEDSSSVLAAPFGPSERESIERHFHQHGHAPYRSGFKLHEGECLCERCHVPMNDVGGGGNQTFYSCGGCDERVIQRTDGKVLRRWRDKYKEFFEVSQELREGK